MHINSKNIEFIPLGGISSQKTVVCNETGKYLIYDSDRYGFNNQDHIWDSNNIDLILIGDSFAHGSCVDSSNNIAGQITQKTKNNIINLGYGGNGPLIELAVLIEYGISIKPKKVLWIYYEGNDLVNLVNEKKNDILLSYLNNDNTNYNLIKNQKKIDINLYEILSSYEKKDQSLSELSVLEEKTNKNIFLKIIKFQKIRDLITIFFTPNRVENITLDKSFLEIIVKAKQITRTWGGEFYFVYIPAFERFINNSKNFDNLYKKIELINFLKINNIKYLDLYEELLKDYNEVLSLYPFGVAGHFNEKGYDLIAEKMIKFIEK